MFLLSLRKATRSARMPSITSISTNAAINHKLQAQVVQDFRNQFWEAAALRSARRGGFKNDEARVIENAVPKNSNGRKHLSQEDANAIMLRKCAREDLFKHFRMSAASRAMKRGDGVMSKYFSLNEVQSMHRYEETGDLCTELPVPDPSLTDVSTARKAREDMHHHFWSSHRARKDAQNDAGARLPVTARLPTFTSANHGNHLHEHRFKLPTTLNDVYIEFGSQARGKNQQPPRPMAITESKPPFKIVDVNKAWTELCGYTRDEAVDSTLKELLQGPKTNTAVANGLVASLLQQGNMDTEHEVVLVNYRSDGRRFRNHVRVGRIKDEAGETTHFVGVFRELCGVLSSSSHDDLYANV
mmetsp:Transcript_6292/g.14210  ORF Transcript_6292/g.14210 Transcript_6292/m.14210 type:complete len:357 (+) Transcript_6292:87-1157(+)